MNLQSENHRLAWQEKRPLQSKTGQVESKNFEKVCQTALFTLKALLALFAIKFSWGKFVSLSQRELHLLEIYPEVARL